MFRAFAIIILFVCSASFATSQQLKHITSLVPSCGPLNGATSVIIKGKGFLPADEVKFGGTVLSGPHVEYKSTEEIMLIISGAYAAVSKNFTVEVVSKDGKTESNVKHFYIYDTPNYIQEIQPKIGWEGDTLIAKGRFLDCGAVKCRFGAVQMTADAFYVSKAEIKCKVPRLDNHAVASVNLNKTNSGLSKKKTPNNSQTDAVQKNVDPPPDPDNAKKFTISSDGQHFDSIPDNIIFTYRDPVTYVVDWIWLVGLMVSGALLYLACLIACCSCGYKAMKKKLTCQCCKGKWCLNSRKGYDKI